MTREHRNRSVTEENADLEAGNTQKIHNTGRNARKRSGRKSANSIERHEETAQNEMRQNRTKREGTLSTQLQNRGFGVRASPLLPENQRLSWYKLRTDVPIAGKLTRGLAKIAASAGLVPSRTSGSSSRVRLSSETQLHSITSSAIAS